MGGAYRKDNASVEKKDLVLQLTWSTPKRFKRGKRIGKRERKKERDGWMEEGRERESFGQLHKNYLFLLLLFSCGSFLKILLNRFLSWHLF